jgi:hypothetical protein
MSITSCGCRRAGVAAALIAFSSPALAQNTATPQGDDTQDGALVAWLADANIGALRLQNDELKAQGDLTLGIGQDWWGGTAWGSGSAYEIDNGAGLNDTTKLEGTGDAWLTTGDAPDVLRLVLRASGGGFNYSSTVYKKASGSYTDDDSWFGRGSLLIGGQLRPDPTFHAYLAVGGGFQYEWYDTTGFVASNYTFDDKQELSFVGSARLEAHWTVAQDIVSLRVRSLATYFQLTRNSEFLAASGGTVSQQLASTSFSQLEVSSRGFIDVDAASFFGFRPTLSGGLDYVRVSGEGQSQSTTVPVFGAGLLHPWM